MFQNKLGTILKNKRIKEKHQNAKESKTKTDNGEDTIYSVGTERKVTEGGSLDLLRNTCVLLKGRTCCLHMAVIIIRFNCILWIIGMPVGTHTQTHMYTQEHTHIHTDTDTQTCRHTHRWIHIDTQK